MNKHSNAVLSGSSSAPPMFEALDALAILPGDELLEGEVEGNVAEEAQVSTFAIQPPNFIGMSPIPKVVVEVGDEIKAGDILFFDKKQPEIKYASPVSGEVLAVNRGAKRSIAEVVILKDKEMKYREVTSLDLEKGSREDLVNHLLENGAWPMIQQRPFNIVAEPGVTPNNIFISTFDTAPLAPDNNVVVEGKGDAFQKGLDVLNKLTDGKVYLGLDANSDSAPSEVFTKEIPAPLRPLASIGLWAIVPSTETALSISGK